MIMEPIKIDVVFGSDDYFETFGIECRTMVHMPSDTIQVRVTATVVNSEIVSFGRNYHQEGGHLHPDMINPEIYADLVEWIRDKHDELQEQSARDDFEDAEYERMRESNNGTS